MARRFCHDDETHHDICTTTDQAASAPAVADRSRFAWSSLRLSSSCCCQLATFVDAITVINAAAHLATHGSGDNVAPSIRGGDGGRNDLGNRRPISALVASRTCARPFGTPESGSRSYTSGSLLPIVWIFCARACRPSVHFLLYSTAYRLVCVRFSCVCRRVLCARSSDVTSTTVIQPGFDRSKMPADSPRPWASQPSSFTDSATCRAPLARPQVPGLVSSNGFWRSKPGVSIAPGDVAEPR